MWYIATSFIDIPTTTTTTTAIILINAHPQLPHTHTDTHICQILYLSASEDDTVGYLTPRTHQYAQTDGQTNRYSQRHSCCPDISLEARPSVLSRGYLRWLEGRTPLAGVAGVTSAELVQFLSDTKISDLDDVICSEEEVSWFDVLVHNASTV